MSQAGAIGISAGQNNNEVNQRHIDLNAASQIGARPPEVQSLLDDVSSSLSAQADQKSAQPVVTSEGEAEIKSLQSGEAQIQTLPIYELSDSSIDEALKTYFDAGGTVEGLEDITVGDSGLKEKAQAFLAERKLKQPNTPVIDGSARNMPGFGPMLARDSKRRGTAPAAPSPSTSAIASTSFINVRSLQSSVTA